MYKTILAYIDDPKMAEVTVDRASGLARAFDSDVILAQVVVPQPTMANPWSGGYEDTGAMRDAEGMLAPWRGQLMQQGIGVQIAVGCQPFLQRQLQQELGCQRLFQRSHIPLFLDALRRDVGFKHGLQHAFAHCLDGFRNIFGFQ